MEKWRKGILEQACSLRNSPLVFLIDSTCLISSWQYLIIGGNSLVLIEIYFPHTLTWYNVIAWSCKLLQ